MKYAALITKFILVVLILNIFSDISIINVSAAEDKKPLEGKKISILGDSISTFMNESCGDAAQTTNSTITNNRCFYVEGTNGVGLQDTWWMQVIEELGGEILVNNSFSGSTIYKPNDTDAPDAQCYKDRCVNLHDNTGDNAGEKPDIIIVFVGTNDFAYSRPTIGTYEGIDFDEIIIETDSGFEYAEPTTSCEAYTIMLHKITHTYPDAEVYCFNLNPRSTIVNNYEPTLIDFNKSIKRLAEKFGCITVDNYNHTGFTTDPRTEKMYLADGIHPNIYGMDALTTSFLNAFYTNSKYAPDKSYHNINYELSGAIPLQGYETQRPAGSDFYCKLSSIDGAPFEIKVFSGDEDITNISVIGNEIFIDEINNEIKIYTCLKEPHTLSQYYFENTNNNISCIANNEFSDNTPKAISDENVLYYKLSNDIMLKSIRRWSIVWKSNCLENGTFMLSGSAVATDEGNIRIGYNCSTGLFGIEEYHSGKQYTYGIDVKNYDLDLSVEHTYRISNVPDTNMTNTLYLYVDGKLIAPLNTCYVDGTEDKYCNQLVGRDIYIKYIGDASSPLVSQNFEYIKIYESIDNATHKHQMIYTNSYELSCTQNRATEKLCECGYSEITIEEECTGHLASEIKTLTQDNKTYTYKECTVCNAILEKKEIPSITITVPLSQKIYSYIKISIIPLILLFTSIPLRKSKTRKNRRIGFRTPFTLINDDIWIFANSLFSKLWLIFGTISLIASAIALIPLLNTIHIINNSAVAIIIAIQLSIVIILSIIVEIITRKKFNKDGTMKDKAVKQKCTKD